MDRAIALLAVVLCGPSCLLVETRRTHTPDPPLADHALPVRAWKAIAEDEVVGEIVCFESTLQRGEPLFMVRNRWQQDLGLIDRLGRAFRFRPHAEDADWVGTGTVVQGAARILEAEASFRLEEVPLLNAEH